MRLYIDPGTGSMLFAVLLGAFGVLRFAFKGVFVKLKFLLSGGQKVETNGDAIPLVIFSDDKRYWQVFEPVCRELDARGFDTVYMTASEDDPALKASYPHLHVEFIGAGNRPFAKLNFLKAVILLSTTPGLDVYQWKRSRDVKWYVHMLHGNEVVAYHSFGVDFYDAILLSADYQAQEIRALEALRNLPEKELVKIGVPYLDEMTRRLQEEPRAESPYPTVLVAPSWGKNSLLHRFGTELLDQLIATGFHIIIRPHPQSFTSEKDLLYTLMASYPEGPHLEWNKDPDNFQVLHRSDIMISDFSSVIFDFALVFDKPVICAYTNLSTDMFDVWWLDQPLWTESAIPRVGAVLTEENLRTIKEMITACLSEDSYTVSRHQVRGETWAYRGEGARRTVDYLTKKYQALTNAATGVENKC